MFSQRMKLLQYLQWGSEGDVTLKREYGEHCILEGKKKDKKKKENTKFVQKGFGINVERIREKVVRI